MSVKYLMENLVIVLVVYAALYGGSRIWYSPERRRNLKKLEVMCKESDERIEREVEDEMTRSGGPSGRA